MLIQKSKGYSTFNEQKVKNIAIKYRLQSIFPRPGPSTDTIHGVLGTGMLYKSSAGYW